MKKHLWIVLLLVVALAVPVMANQAAKVFVDGQELKTDVPPQNVNGRILVPLRAIAEGLGKTVDWNNETKTVTVTGVSELDKVEAISTEWGATRKTGYNAYPAGRGYSCAKCHEGNSFSTGEFDEAKISGMTCQSCHTGNGKELMDQGKVGGLNVDYAWLNDYEAGTGALCMSCHNANRDPEAEFAKQTDGMRNAGRNLSYPHYSGNAALYTGLGGMEYPDMTYAKSFAHPKLEDSCTSCHMPKTEDGYKAHSFKMDEAYISQTCGSCHAGIDSYDYNGFQTDLYNKLKKVEKAILADTGAAELSSGGGQLIFLDSEGNAIPAEKISQEAYVAYYNYKLVKAEGSMGIHNPKYAKSLLENSYKALTGNDL
ncbi:MAG: ammonia-forming cytochrome c nitrite reductase subunit c552 [Bacillota bacterium]|nr:ammonia-forming cytochrome c nitrite reductase subunit c552 [Bacillota bacterium]